MLKNLEAFDRLDTVKSILEVINEFFAKFQAIECQINCILAQENFTITLGILCQTVNKISRSLVENFQIYSKLESEQFFSHFFEPFLKICKISENLIRSDLIEKIT